MSTLGWCLLGAGIYVFVAVTFPLLVRLGSDTLTRDDALILVGVSWAWPVAVPVLAACILFALVSLGLDQMFKGIGFLGKSYINVLEGDHQDKKAVS